MGSSVSVPLTSSRFQGETLSLLPFSLLARFLEQALFVGTDHKHIPDSSPSVLSISAYSFLLQQYNCLVLSDSHVYKVRIRVHVQYTLFKQSITVTNIDNDNCHFFFFKFEPVFSPRPDYVAGAYKGKVTIVILHSLILGVCGHFNEAVF